MWTFMRAGLVATSASLLLAWSAGAQPPEPVAPPLAQAAFTPPIDGILAAFETHPLVGLGDYHGLAQEFDFYTTLVSDPRFAKQVGNIVVEFGGAAQQATLDRYLNGADVPYAQLRQVWTDTIGWNPIPIYQGYPAFFAAVRAVNLRLPADQRIHVWLGQPPAEWTKIMTRDDLKKAGGDVDAHAADLIGKTILGKHKKALIIYGGAHFTRYPPHAPARPAPQPGTQAKTETFVLDIVKGTPDYASMTGAYAKTLQSRLALYHDALSKLGALKSTTFDDNDPPGVDGFDFKFEQGTFHASLRFDAAGKISAAGLSAYVTRTPWLIDRIEQSYPNAIYVVSPYVGFVDRACTQKFDQAAQTWAIPTLVTASRGSLERTLSPPGCAPTALKTDALLYLGLSSSLRTAPLLTDLYTDLAFRKEIGRRAALTGAPPALQQPPDMRDYTMTPRPFEPFAPGER